MTEWTEKLADRVSEAFGEQTLIPDEVKAVLWDINSEAWQRGILWSRFNGSVPPPSEANPYRKPPLVLPTEPTWGIAIVHEHKIAYAGKWTHRRDGDKNWLVDVLPGGIQTGAAGVKAFIPFTEEQIAQIEAAQR